MASPVSSRWGMTAIDPVAPGRPPVLEPRALRSAATSGASIALGSVTMGSAVTGAFRAEDMRFAPGLRLSWHFHGEPILTVPLRGRFELASRYRRLVCRPGTVFTVPPGEQHSSVFGANGARSLVIAPVDGCTLQSVAQFFRGRHLVESLRIARIASDIADETRQSDALTPLAVDSMVLLIIALAQRCELDVQPGARPLWLRRAVELIHDTPDHRLSVSEIAVAVAATPDRLARAFRTVYGVSIATFARTVRLNQASERLIRTDDPITVIARDAGFADQSHFTRAFRRLKGMTPARYRRDLADFPEQRS